MGGMLFLLSVAACHAHSDTSNAPLCSHCRRCLNSAAAATQIEELYGCVITCLHDTGHTAKTVPAGRLFASHSCLASVWAHTFQIVTRLATVVAPNPTFNLKFTPHPLHLVRASPSTCGPVAP